MALPFIIIYFLPVNIKARKANYFMRIKNYESALNLYTELINKKGKICTLYNNRASAYCELKRYDEAIKDLEKSLRLKQEQYIPDYIYASIYEQLKEYDLMQYHINRCLVKNPPRKHKFDLLVSLGIYWTAKNEYQKALTIDLQALELLDNNYVAYNNIGFSYLNLRKFDEAIPYFNKSIKLNPENAYSYNNRGYCYANLGNFEQAFRDFTSSYNIDPSNSYLYKFRGMAYKMSGRNAEAINDLEKAIEKNPDFISELKSVIEELKS